MEQIDCWWRGWPKGKASAKSWSSPVKIRVAHTLRVAVTHPNGVVGASRKDAGPAKRSKGGWWKKRKETERVEGTMQRVGYTARLACMSSPCTCGQELPYLQLGGWRSRRKGGRKDHLTQSHPPPEAEKQPHPNHAGDQRARTAADRTSRRSGQPTGRRLFRTLVEQPAPRTVATLLRRTQTRGGLG